MLGANGLRGKDGLRRRVDRRRLATFTYDRGRPRHWPRRKTAWRDALAPTRAKWTHAHAAPTDASKPPQARRARMSFFTSELLNRKTPIGALWSVGTNTVSPRQMKHIVAHSDISALCRALLMPSGPIALRTQAVLLRGVVLIAEAQSVALLEDVVAHMYSLRHAFSRRMDMARPSATFASITRRRPGEAPARASAQYDEPLDALGAGAEAEEAPDEELLLLLGAPEETVAISLALPAPGGLGAAGLEGELEEEGGPEDIVEAELLTPVHRAPAALITLQGDADEHGAAGAPPLAADVAMGDAGFGALERGEYREQLGLYALGEQVQAAASTHRPLRAAEDPALASGDDDDDDDDDGGGGGDALDEEEDGHDVDGAGGRAFGAEGLVPDGALARARVEMPHTLTVGAGPARAPEGADGPRSAEADDTRSGAASDAVPPAVGAARAPDDDGSNNADDAEAGVRAGPVAQGAKPGAQQRERTQPAPKQRAPKLKIDWRTQLAATKYEGWVQDASATVRGAPGASPAGGAPVGPRIRGLGAGAVGGETSATTSALRRMLAEPSVRAAFRASPIDSAHAWAAGADANADQDAAPSPLAGAAGGDTPPSRALALVGATPEGAKAPVPVPAGAASAADEEDEPSPEALRLGALPGSRSRSRSTDALLEEALAEQQLGGMGGTPVSADAPLPPFPPPLPSLSPAAPLHPLGGHGGLSGDESDDEPDGPHDRAHTRTPELTLGAAQLAPQLDVGAGTPGAAAGGRLGRSAFALLETIRRAHGALQDQALSAAAGAGRSDGAEGPARVALAFQAHVLDAQLRARMQQERARTPGTRSDDDIRRRLMACSLMELLTLASHGRVLLGQEAPYTDIAVEPGPSWASDSHENSSTASGSTSARSGLPSSSEPEDSN